MSTSSVITGAQGSPVFDFTSTDFASVQEDLTTFAETTFPADLWTDFNDSDFGSHLLELMAYATDLIAYNMNSQALECIVTTLVVEQNFRNIAKSLDYTLKSAVGASVAVTFTLDPTPGLYPFTLSHHLQLSTQSTGTQQGPIIFQPVADQQITYAEASGLSFTLAGVGAEAGTESFDETLGVTNGQAGQQFTLSNSYLIDGTLEVSVGAQSYSLVPNSIESTPTDQIYTLDVDQNGVATVTFGDGVNGVIPPKNQTVLATYYYGGGELTNVPAGTIVNISGTADGSSIPTALLSVTNPLPASGGGDKQTVANAQQNLPLSLKANNRGVTLGDYAALTDEVVGVLACNAYAGAAQGGSFPILLYVVPNGGGLPTTILANQIVVALLKSKMAGKRIRVLPAVYVNLQFAVDAYIQQSSPKLVVANTLLNALLTLYALGTVTFGDTFSLQALYDNTNSNNIAGISRVLYQQFTVQPYAAAHVNAPVQGNGIPFNTAPFYGSLPGLATQIGGSPTSANLTTPKRREWLVKVIGSNTGAGVFCNQFQVIQRQLGTVTLATDTLVEDEAANFAPGALTSTGPQGQWTFQPNPDTTQPNNLPGGDSINTFGIVGNTQNSISVTGGLVLADVEPGDPYVVEILEPTVGKILTTTVTAAGAFSTVPVASSQSFLPGDLVRVVSGSVEYRCSVNSIPDGTHIHLNLPAPLVAISLNIGDTIDYLWQSADGSLQFSVLDGTTAFVPGSDSFYVDTYPLTGDLTLRPENYPLISADFIDIVTVGGV